MGTKGSAAQQVALLTKEIASCSGDSGTVVCRDDDVFLFDAPEWTDDMSDCVRSRFPGARIRLAQSNASLSGFVVGINTTEVASRQRELGLALLSLCLVALLLLSACLFACVLHPAYVLRLTMMPWA